MSMKAPLASVITRVGTMSDNTIRLQVDCQEMLPEQITEIFQLKGSLGYFFFLDRPSLVVDTSDLPEIKLEKWEKSPSQRLRAVLFRYWEQLQDAKSTELSFEAWYREEMEKLISTFKDRLN